MPDMPSRSLKRRLEIESGKSFRQQPEGFRVGGPLRSIDVAARIMLVGDAAGHTHAITGGGIPQTVIAGGMAGRAAVACINGNKEAIQILFRSMEK